MKKIFFILLLFPGVVIGQFDSDSLSNVQSNESLETPEQYEKAKSIWIKYHYYSSINHYDSCMYYGDLFLNHRIKYGTVYHAIYAYHHKINNLKKFNKLNEAFKLTLTAYDQYCNKNIDNINCEDCHLIYDQLSQFMITIKNYRQGINYINNGCITQKNEMHFFLKAKLYVLLDEPDSALIQTLESIRIARVQNIPNNLVAAYNQHGLISKNLERYDDAIFAFSEAIKLVDSLSLDESRYGYIVGNLGSCYYQKGDFDAAYKYLQIDADKSKERDADRESYLNAEIMLVKIDLKRKDHKLALYRLDGLMKVHESLLRPLQKLTVLELYMQAFKLSGNKSKYEFYLKQWIALTKTEATLSIDANQNLTEILSANALEEITIQIENEKQLLSQQLVINEQESRLQKWVLIAGALFIILVTFFFLSRYRKSALLKDTLLKLANKEQAFLKLKVQEESRNVQILSHELMFKKDFSKRIIDKLEQIEGISKPILKNLEFFIENELDVKSSRAHVQKRMGYLSSSFYADLKIKHGKLTDLELKLAAMIVMKMSNKEIALNRGITLESSKKAKNRLKKKLGVSEYGELSSYLNRFL
jgi:DNA-binding CsgD family transcriptional regulator